MAGSRALLLAGVAAALFSATDAGAQVQPQTNTPPQGPDTPPPAVDSQQGDIIVTAQRRSESLQRTPVAVQVLSGDTLARQAIVSERDLQISAPGLTVKASQNDNQLNYSLRGQTVDTYTSSLPSVLPYVDEVQVGGVGQSAFYDLQSVQVIKGPQGTLFGRNATGGAVLFTTAKPTEELAGYAAARYGTFNDAQVEGAVGGGIVPDKLLVRVAGSYRSRDGYQLNLFDGSKLGRIRRLGLRGSITLKPIEGLTNDLVVDYLHDSGTNIAAPVYYVVPVAANVPGNPFVPDNVIFPGLAAAGQQQQQRGPYVVNVDSIGDHHLTKLVVSNVTSLRLGADTSLKNVFGYVNTKFFDASDIDGTPFGIDGRGTATSTTPKGSVGNIRQFSEELQLLGKLFGGRLEYVTGVYAASIQDHTVNNSYILAGIGLPPQINAGTTTSRSIAGYAQGTFDTGLANFKVTGGIRYTSENIRFVRDANDLYSPTAFPNFAPFYADGRFVPQNDTFNKISWTAGIQNQVTSGLLLYVSSRHSFRSGGFNFHAPPTPGFADQSGGEFRPEVATDLEVGAKFRGVLSGVPVTANLAAYQMWVDNVQRAFYGPIYNGLAGITVNVPQAQVTGVEFDGSVRPAQWLTIGGNVNYTNARFTDNVVPVLGTNGTTATARYDTYPDTPRWSGLFYTDVTRPVTQRFNLVVHGDVFAQTSNYFSSTGLSLNPGTRIPGYGVANFRVGLDPRGGKGFSISAVLKNAFDKTYYTGGIGFASLFALNIAVPGEPRTVMVEARYRF